MEYDEYPLPRNRPRATRITCNPTARPRTQSRSTSDCLCTYHLAPHPPPVLNVVIKFRRKIWGVIVLRCVVVCVGYVVGLLATEVHTHAHRGSGRD